jgi:hypothetical protein
VGELKDVFSRFSSNPKVHQVIGIIVVDISEVYGLFLSRDWSQNLNGYFATDWSHLWLPLNGQPNKIRFNRECYMKHTFIDLNDPNEPILCNDSLLGNCRIDTFFGNFTTKISPFSNSEQ